VAVYVWPLELVNATAPTVGIPDPVGAAGYFNTTSLTLIHGMTCCGFAAGPAIGEPLVESL